MIEITQSKGYRPEWWDEFAKGRSILEIALDVKTTEEGSFERSAKEQAQDLVLLHQALEMWKPSSNKFDNAVKALIEAALEDLSLRG